MEIKERKEKHPLANIKEDGRKHRRRSKKHSKYGAFAIMRMDKRYKKRQKENGTYKKQKRDKAFDAFELIGDIVELIFDFIN